MLTALAALEKCIERGEAAVEADFALHVAIAEATNNSRFVEILKAMGRELIPRGSLSTSSGEKSDKVYLEQIDREHWNIITAICEGNVEGARSAMSAHLNGSMQRYREIIRRR
ncbi:DNA-binding transcriptional regulator, FadR family OS=Bosea thiooxidans OX=53254 GN=ARD30_15110 PE=4 SV=1 [Bosea thiooxidans]